MSLCIPALSQGRHVLGLRCRSEPNPYLHDVPHVPARPFYTPANNAVIITVIRMSSAVAHHDPMATIVMHRHALLDIITNLTSCRQSNDVHDGNLSSAVPTDAQAPPAIPWSEWGPPISRLFATELGPTRWMPMSAGQRCAVLDPVDNSGRKYRISIIDFNPRNISNVPSDLPGKLVVEPSGTVLSRGIFEEDIEMGLGCTIYTAPEVYDFDLLMEEERLLGVKVRIHVVTLHLSIHIVDRTAISAKLR